MLAPSEVAAIADDAHEAFDEVARDRIVAAGVGPSEAALDAALDAVYDRERARLDMGRVLYLAEMDSQHFQWRAVGRSEEEAREALARVWDAHMEQVADDMVGYGDVMSGVDALEQYAANVHPIRLGVGLRDGSEVRTHAGLTDG